MTDLDALYKKAKQDTIRGAAYKTVATFAGLTRRKLWLREGKTAHTDGHEIVAPFEHEGFYQLVEHELSHILFQSDGLAKQLFIERYTATMAEALRQGGMEFPPGLKQAFGEFMNEVIGVLEDIRCESLWSLLYPGSYDLLQKIHKKEVVRFLDRAHMSSAMYFIVLSAGVDPPKGKYTRMRPLFEEAMRKVERRSFGATLAVSKWLIQKLVTEELRWMRELRRNADPNNLPGGANYQPASSPTAPAEAQKPADVSERFEGIKRLLAENDVPSALDMMVNDVGAPKFESRDAKRRANELVNYVVNLNTANEAVMDTYLQGSEQAMLDIVEEARASLHQQMEVDDWMTKNAFGKVNLKDVRPGTVRPLSPDDTGTLRKLRSLFFRVMGRRKYELHERGSSIDVAAYIEAKLNREVRPCFNAEEKGRGFKVLVLIDRSGSMSGSRTVQAERACRILTRALDFPFVEFNVWGFQSLSNGELDITRFPTKEKHFSFESKEARVAGNTPLHLALRVVNRYMEVGSEAKQIICITDGFPTHVAKSGHAYGTKTLVNFVRDEVRYARKRGTNVTGVLIGSGMKTELLAQMFGSRQNWHQLSDERFGDELVRLISTSFMQYLRNG